MSYILAVCVLSAHIHGASSCLKGVNEVFPSRQACLVFYGRYTKPYSQIPYDFRRFEHRYWQCVSSVRASHMPELMQTLR